MTNAELAKYFASLPPNDEAEITIINADGGCGTKENKMDEINEWLRSQDPEWGQNDCYFTPDALSGPTEIVVKKGGKWEASYEGRVDEYQEGVGLEALQKLFVVR